MSILLQTVWKADLKKKSFGRSNIKLRGKSDTVALSGYDLLSYEPGMRVCECLSEHS